MDKVELATKIAQIVLVLLVAGALILFFVFVFLKKRKRKMSNKIKDDKKTKVRDASEFIPVKTIKNNIITLDGERRFIASINCKGFDFFTANAEERYITQDGYLAFINTIESRVTMRIDSSAVDLSVPIANHKKAIDKYKATLGNLYDSFNKYFALYKECADGEEKDSYGILLSELRDKINVTEWKISHTENVVEYQTEISGREANPIQEERYIFDFTFNPKDFPDDITEAEIEERAVKELENKANNMKRTLSLANVKCKRDTSDDLYNLSYRHFHPFASDIYRDTGADSDTDRIVSGERSFTVAKKKYDEVQHNALIKDLLSQAMENKAKKEKPLSVDEEVEAMDRKINGTGDIDSSAKVQELDNKGETINMMKANKDSADNDTGTKQEIPNQNGQINSELETPLFASGVSSNNGEEVIL